MLVTVKLVPYEILVEKATSYADISLTMSNLSQNDIKIEVEQIEIVTAGSERVLMSSTHQDLKLPAKIAIQPGESRILEYRLKSESKIYQPGQYVIARISYRQNEQTEQVVQSSPEAVALMIP